MISRDYNPDNYRLPLTNAQEQELIDAATLEDLMRNPRYGGYDRTDEQRQAMTYEAWRWESIAPSEWTAEDYAYLNY
jgi:hypothetical protein